MRVSLYEAKFGVDFTENQLTTIIEALIDGDHKWLARERLILAEELRNSFAAELESRKRDFLDVQIQTKLDALDD